MVVWDEEPAENQFPRPDWDLPFLECTRPPARAWWTLIHIRPKVAEQASGSRASIRSPLPQQTSEPVVQDSAQTL
jgi:hypothetical protein